MSLASNKQLVRDFYGEAINGRDLYACDRLLTTDFVHNGEQRGRDGQRGAVEAFLSAFSPLRHEILLMLAEDDLVCARQRWSGTHVGEFMGHAATNRRVSFSSTAILKIRGDEIAEAWDQIELAALLNELEAPA
jgi:predicted ester cyclase